MFMGYKVGVIIYTRLSSKRLPRKALIDINGTSLIQNVINVCKKIESDHLILATSNLSSDDDLELIAFENEIDILRGELDDVAKRTVDCINKYDLDYFVRINGDSPILPIQLINNSLRDLKVNEDSIDLITNLQPRSFPYGYSIEIINAKTFKSSYSLFDEFNKEHITSYFYNYFNNFKIVNVLSDIKIEADIVLTVDDLKSLEKVKKIFRKYPNIQNESLKTIIKNYKKL